MEFRVKRPLFDASNRMYCFQLEDAPAFELISPPSEMWAAPQPPVDFLREFLTLFLQKAATSFSASSLTLETIQARLHHRWNLDNLGDSEKGDLDTQVQEGISIRTRWIPAKILFFPTRIELLWILISASAVEPEIPPGFLEPLPEPPALAAEVLESGEEDRRPAVAMQEIEPPESTQTLSGAEELRAQERKRVRQARLRAALAQLRAERMADRYYRRYGTYELEEGESDLSEEEDETAAVLEN